MPPGTPHKLDSAGFSFSRKTSGSEDAGNGAVAHGPQPSRQNSIGVAADNVAQTGIMKISCLCCSIRRVASQNPHLYQRDIENIVNAIFDEIVKALGREDRVEFRGFGAFSAKIRGARKGRNPRTGAEVQVAQKAIPFFKTGKEMRARLNWETARSID